MEQQQPPAVVAPPANSAVAPTAAFALDGGPGGAASLPRLRKILETARFAVSSGGGVDDDGNSVDGNAGGALAAAALAAGRVATRADTIFAELSAISATADGAYRENIAAHERVSFKYGELRSRLDAMQHTHSLPPSVVVEIEAIGNDLRVALATLKSARASFSSAALSDGTGAVAVFSARAGKLRDAARAVAESARDARRADTEKRAQALTFLASADALFAAAANNSLPVDSPDAIEARCREAMSAVTSADASASAAAAAAHGTLGRLNGDALTLVTELSDERAALFALHTSVRGQLEVLASRVALCDAEQGAGAANALSPARSSAAVGERGIADDGGAVRTPAAEMATNVATTTASSAGPLFVAIANETESIKQVVLRSASSEPVSAALARDAASAGLPPRLVAAEAALSSLSGSIGDALRAALSTSLAAAHTLQSVTSKARETAAALSRRHVALVAAVVSHMTAISDAAGNDAARVPAIVAAGVEVQKLRAAAGGGGAGSPGGVGMGTAHLPSAEAAAARLSSLLQDMRVEVALASGGDAGRLARVGALGEDVAAFVAAAVAGRQGGVRATTDILAAVSDVEDTLSSLSDAFRRVVCDEESAAAELSVALAALREASLAHVPSRGVAAAAAERALAILERLRAAVVLTTGPSGARWTALQAAEADVRRHADAARVREAAVSGVPAGSRADFSNQLAAEMAALRGEILGGDATHAHSPAPARKAASPTSSYSYNSGGPFSPGGAAGYQGGGSEFAPSFSARAGGGNMLSLVATVPQSVISAAETTDKLMSLSCVLLEEVHGLKSAFASARGATDGASSSRVDALEDALTVARREVELARAREAGAKEREDAARAEAALSLRAERAALDAERSAREAVIADGVRERAAAASAQTALAEELAALRASSAAEVASLQAALVSARTEVQSTRDSLLEQMEAQRVSMTRTLIDREDEVRRYAAAVAEKDATIMESSGRALARLEAEHEEARRRMIAASEEAEARVSRARAEGSEREADHLRRSAQDHNAMLREAESQRAALAGALQKAEAERAAAIESARVAQEDLVRRLASAHALHEAAVGEIREAAAGFVLAGQLRAVLAETERRLIEERKRVISLEKVMGLAPSPSIRPVHSAPVEDAGWAQSSGNLDGLSASAVPAATPAKATQGGTSGRRSSVASVASSSVGGAGPSFAASTRVPPPPPQTLSPAPTPRAQVSVTERNLPTAHSSANSSADFAASLRGGGGGAAAHTPQSARSRTSYEITSPASAYERLAEYAAARTKFDALVASGVTHEQALSSMRPREREMLSERGGDSGAQAHEEHESIAASMATRDSYVAAPATTAAAVRSSASSAARGPLEAAQIIKEAIELEALILQNGRVLTKSFA